MEAASRASALTPPSVAAGPPPGSAAGAPSGPLPGAAAGAPPAAPPGAAAGVPPTAPPGAAAGAPPGAAARPPDTRRLPRVAGLLGLGSLVGYLWALDPAKDGAWPPCPSRVLLGIDCPGCGGLRGTHDLLHGDVVGALDHNLLLPFLLLMVAAPVALWMLPLVGRPARPFTPPLRAYWVAMGLAAVFTVARNLPVPAIAFLGSG